MTAALTPIPPAAIASPLVCFDLTPYALTLRPKTPLAAWGAGLAFLTALDRFSPWWLGDAYNAGEDAYGEDAAQYLDQYAKGTLRNNGYVCRRFPSLSFRNYNDLITFSHMARLASVKDDDTVRRWLECAIAGEWSAARLGDEVAGETGGRKTFSLSMSKMDVNAARLMSKLPVDQLRTLTRLLIAELEAIGEWK